MKRGKDTGCLAPYLSSMIQKSVKKLCGLMRKGSAEVGERPFAARDLSKGPVLSKDVQHFLLMLLLLLLILRRKRFVMSICSIVTSSPHYFKNG